MGSYNHHHHLAHDCQAPLTFPPADPRDHNKEKRGVWRGWVQAGRGGQKVQLGVVVVVAYLGVHPLVAFELVTPRELFGAE